MIKEREGGNTVDSTLYILLAHTAGAVLIKHLRAGVLIQYRNQII